MKMRLTLLLSGMLLLALSCGPKKAATVPSTRDFPMAEVPMMITEPEERLVWLTQHFWDRFCDTTQLYFCDSLTINGVKAQKVEEQVGLFASMLQELPLEEGQKAMEACFTGIESFQAAKPEGNVYKEVSALIARYFFDPNSPVRSEDLYLPFVSRLADSPLTEASMRPAYHWDTEVCQMNRRGTPAADFTFVDTAGKRRTLYSIDAWRTLLIFGNPDCHACKELVEEMEQTPEVKTLIENGRLKVVDIYIDEDLDLWKAGIANYPKEWINGYDPSFTIRTDRLYSVRALPSLYLLDQDKKVLQKDALPQQILSALLY